MFKQKILVSWSSGKDSAWALYSLQQRTDIEVVGLLTTMTDVHQRVSIHGIRRDLLEHQATCCNLPLWPVMLPNPCTNKDYEEAMQAAMLRAKKENISYVAFGDLFLEDVRDYRISRLTGTGIKPLFPLWSNSTRDLAKQMVENGLKAVIVSVDPYQLDPSFLGRKYDASLLNDLPDAVDPCGENGEFHTYVYDGPMFTKAIPIYFGRTVKRDNFFYKDLLVDTDAVYRNKFKNRFLD